MIYCFITRARLPNDHVKRVAVFRVIKTGIIQLFTDKLVLKANSTGFKNQLSQSHSLPPEKVIRRDRKSANIPCLYLIKINK